MPSPSPSPRLRAGSAAAVVAALLLTACGNSSGSTAASSATAAGSASSSTGPTNGVAITSATTPSAPPSSSGKKFDFKAEVWADNWFSLTVNGEPVGQDSVPITTERSFNSETIMFSASYPLTIAMVTKDYKANDTGLEYIGTNRQQMGDGGFIAQITETSSGKLVAATGAPWKGLVIHRAPINKDCEKSAAPETTCKSEIGAEPSGWANPGFDDSQWVAATTYTAEQVGVKDGYNNISWSPRASLIWTSDLKADNTILWRATVAA